MIGSKFIQTGDTRGTLATYESNEEKILLCLLNPGGIRGGYIYTDPNTRKIIIPITGTGVFESFIPGFGEKKHVIHRKRIVIYPDQPFMTINPTDEKLLYASVLKGENKYEKYGSWRKLAEESEEWLGAHPDEGIDGILNMSPEDFTRFGGYRKEIIECRDWLESIRPKSARVVGILDASKHSSQLMDTEFAHFLSFLSDINCFVLVPEEL